MLTRTKSAQALAVLIAASLSGIAGAQTPLGTTFTYQGQLKSGGSPANGNFDMVFRLFDFPAGGAALATQTLPGVGVANGLFTVQLDFGAAYNGNKRWLEITVDATPLSPRQELTAAPNALFASNANQLDGLDSTAFLTSVPNPLMLSGTNNAYIISAQNSSAVSGASGVFGTATAATGQVYGVQGFTESTQGFAVFGVATSTTGPSRGGYFESASTGGIGLVGVSKATTGENYGVYGHSDSTAGRGVYAVATASSGQTFGGRFEAESTAGYGVFGLAKASTGPAYGVSGHTASSDGVGVQGYAYNGGGTTWGGYFRSDSTSGHGATGYANAASGVTYGLYGQSASTTGRGVYGLADAPTGNTLGVFGQSASTSGRGVYGYANAATGANFGVFGQSDSTSGRGVYGYASAGSGTTYGGSFETSSSSTSATGVSGLASALSGATIGGSFETRGSGQFATGVYGYASAFGTDYNYGVWGQSNSTAGVGVIGNNNRTTGIGMGVFGISSSQNGRGVYGLADSPAGFGNYGVYGEANGNFSWGVYSNGSMGASGTKPFRIDHPDDPENKYLLHYSAESPEVINFYSGNATLDAAGQAVVELPHYFAKINKDPRYTVTAVGAPMPMLHVADVIDEAALSAGAKAEPGVAATRCTFRIAGGVPGKKVSWEVKAVRNDRWVQQRGASVEVEKQGLEKGTYQHPELYGQPPEKGMNYDAARHVPEPLRPSPTAVRDARRP